MGSALLLHFTGMALGGGVWCQNAGVQILAVPTTSCDIHTSHLNFLSFLTYKIGQTICLAYRAAKGVT